MLTDLFFVFSCSNVSQNLEISLSDSNGLISSAQQQSGEIILSGKISLPNCLTLTLNDLGEHPSKAIRLDSMKLGSLAVPVSTIDQMCRFQPMHGNSEMVTRHWWCDGCVVIDLFAKDWVQFHLIYGHKIVP